MTTTTDPIDLAIQQQALDIELQLHDLHEQGGLERPQREPHKLTEAGSTPAPATNPNAGCFAKVHPFPKGRWS